MTACTTTPSAGTKTRNDTWTERAISVTVVCPRARLRTASTDAPHRATQAGAIPTDWATANPAGVSATTTNTNTGEPGGAPSAAGFGLHPQVLAEEPAEDGVEGGHRGQHHRGQQHHGGVQAQHRRDGRGDDEHPPQHAGRPDAVPGDRRARRLGQALVVAQLGQH